MIKKTVFLFITSCISIATINSCSKTDTSPVIVNACTLTVSFTGNIKRILDVNCNSCHAPGSGNAAALIKWTYDGSYTSALNNSNNIKSQISSGLMPQTGGLPQIVRDSVSCWVEKGSPN